MTFLDGIELGIHRSVDSALHPVTAKGYLGDGFFLGDREKR